MSTVNKLNATYREAKRTFATYFKAVPALYSGVEIIDKTTTSVKQKNWYGGYEEVYDVSISCGNANGTCCGIDELDFTCLYNYVKRVGELDDAKFTALVAGYVHHSHSLVDGERPRDSRFVFVGIPVKVGEGSQYDIAFYKRLTKVLESFGFVPLTNPYTNNNSRNEIIVLGAQY